MHSKVNISKKEHLAESEERMIEDRGTLRENNQDLGDNTSGDHNNIKRPTIDPPDDEEAVDGEENKDEKEENNADDDLEQEDIY